MSVFKRFSDIINSNLNAMLDKAENPQKLLDYIITEMEDTLADARSDAASILADKKSFQREIKDLNKRVVRWEDKALLAVEKQKEGLAKSALLEKRQCQEKISICENALEEVEHALSSLEEDLERLQLKLAEAHKKRQLLHQHKNYPSKGLEKKVMVYQPARQRNRISATLQKLDRFERKLDRLEAEVESYDLGRNKTLIEEIAALDVDESLEEELQSLKDKIVQKAS